MTLWLALIKALSLSLDKFFFMKTPKLCATTPIEVENIKLTSPKTTAVGLPAIQSSMKHLLQEVPLKNCAPLLFSVNQMNGFDCPGCAWPDPDDERSKLGEYCENGVKAIAEEATRKRVTPSFLKQYSIQEISCLSLIHI